MTTPAYISALHDQMDATLRDTPNSVKLLTLCYLVDDFYAPVARILDHLLHEIKAHHPDWLDGSDPAFPEGHLTETMLYLKSQVLAAQSLANDTTTDITGQMRDAVGSPDRAEDMLIRMAKDISDLEKACLAITRDAVLCIQAAEAEGSADEA